MDPGPVASFKKAANFPRSTNPWVVTLWRTKNRWFQTAARQKQLVQPKNRFKNRLVQQITNKTRKSPLFIKHVFFPTESQLQQKNTTPLFFTPTLCYLTFFSSSLLHSLPFVPYTFSKEVVWSALHSFCWNLLSGSGPHSTEGATTVNFPDGFFGENLWWLLKSENPTNRKNPSNETLPSFWMETSDKISNKDVSPTTTVA